MLWMGYLIFWVVVGRVKNNLSPACTEFFDRINKIDRIGLVWFRVSGFAFRVGIGGVTGFGVGVKTV